MKSGEIWISKSNPSIGIRLTKYDRKLKAWKFHYVDIAADGSKIFNFNIYEEIKSGKIKNLFSRCGAVGTADAKTAL